jgi:hypothetical protein
MRAMDYVGKSIEGHDVVPLYCPPIGESWQEDVEEVYRELLARSGIPFDERFPWQSARPCRGGLVRFGLVPGVRKKRSPLANFLPLLRSGESEISFCRGSAKANPFHHSIQRRFFALIPELHAGGAVFRK